MGNGYLGHVPTNTGYTPITIKVKPTIAGGVRGGRPAPVSNPNSAPRTSGSPRNYGPSGSPRTYVPSRAQRPYDPNRAKYGLPEPTTQEIEAFNTFRAIKEKTLTPELAEKLDLNKDGWIDATEVEVLFRTNVNSCHYLLIDPNKKIESTFRVPTHLFKTRVEEINKAPNNKTKGNKLSALYNYVVTHASNNLGKALSDKSRAFMPSSLEYRFNADKTYDANSYEIKSLSYFSKWKWTVPKNFKAKGSEIIAILSKIATYASRKEEESMLCEWILAHPSSLGKEETAKRKKNADNFNARQKAIENNNIEQLVHLADFREPKGKLDVFEVALIYEALLKEQLDTYKTAQGRIDFRNNIPIDRFMEPGDYVDIEDIMAEYNRPKDKAKGEVFSLGCAVDASRKREAKDESDKNEIEQKRISTYFTPQELNPNFSLALDIVENGLTAANCKALDVNGDNKITADEFLRTKDPTFDNIFENNQKNNKYIELDILKNILSTARKEDEDTTETVIKQIRDHSDTYKESFQTTKPTKRYELIGDLNCDGFVDAYELLAFADKRENSSFDGLSTKATTGLTENTKIPVDYMNRIYKDCVAEGKPFTLSEILKRVNSPELKNKVNAKRNSDQDKHDTAFLGLGLIKRGGLTADNCEQLDINGDNYIDYRELALSGLPELSSLREGAVSISELQKWLTEITKDADKGKIIQSKFKQHASKDAKFKKNNDLLNSVPIAIAKTQKDGGITDISTLSSIDMNTDGFLDAFELSALLKVGEESALLTDTNLRNLRIPINVVANAIRAQNGRKPITVNDIIKYYDYACNASKQNKRKTTR